MDAQEDDLPLFGEIRHVVAMNVTEYFFVVSVLNTIHFNSHCHAYVVEYPSRDTYAIIKPNELVDHHPLGLYTCSCPQPTHLVSLKYHVVSS